MNNCKNTHIIVSVPCISNINTRISVNIPEYKYSNSCTYQVTSMNV